MLGLKDCANVLVGGALVKGISGGEKRRLSLAVQMISDPSVLVVDEASISLVASVLDLFLVVEWYRLNRVCATRVVCLSADEWARFVHRGCGHVGTGMSWRLKSGLNDIIITAPLTCSYLLQTDIARTGRTVICTIHQVRFSSRQ